MKEGLSRREFDAIKIRAEAVRRCIRMIDQAETMEQRVDWAIRLVSGHIRADDDLFALIAEVARLRDWDG